MLVEKIVVKVPVYPTEDKEKILKALYRCFPAMKFREEKMYDSTRGIDIIYIIGESNKILSLDYIRRDISRSKIKNTAKSILKKSVTEDGVKFDLNKQALMKGKIHFAFEDENVALGNVTVEIKTKNKNLVINWLLL